jgi:hypothetical protein
MDGAEIMLQDLRGTYIRREQPGFLRRALAALQVPAVCLLALVASVVLLWASLRYGQAFDPEPLGYYSLATPVAE